MFTADFREIRTLGWTPVPKGLIVATSPAISASSTWSTWGLAMWIAVERRGVEEEIVVADELIFELCRPEQPSSALHRLTCVDSGEHARRPMAESRSATASFPWSIEASCSRHHSQITDLILRRSSDSMSQRWSRSESARCDPCESG